MEKMSKLIVGAAIAVVSIASPALAQRASRSDPSVSVRHRTHVRISSYQNGFSSSIVPSVPPAYDPGRPYVYVPGMASGGGGF